MAQRGTPLDAVTLARLLRLRREGMSHRRCARLLGVSTYTVWKYTQRETVRRAA